MKTVVVGAPTYRSATNEFVDCLIKLRRKNIPIHKATRGDRTIDTDNCRIVFIPTCSINDIRGYSCDICFGFSKEQQDYFHWSHEPINYNGTLLDYIYEIEGIKE